MFENVVLPMLITTIFEYVWDRNCVTSHSSNA